MIEEIKKLCEIYFGLDDNRDYSFELIGKPQQ